MATAPPVGLPGRLLANLLALVSARIELAQIEVEEAARRALRRVGWLLAVAACGLLALQFGGLYLLLSYSVDARLWMVAGLTLTFLLMTLIAIVACVHLAQTRERLCRVTRSEIADDIASLRSQHDSR